jgi:hypothetical protein
VYRLIEVDSDLRGAKTSCSADFRTVVVGTGRDWLSDISFAD